MAQNGMSLSSERVQRLLQCAICLDKFKDPKLLPCQHTFCLTPCLEGLVEHRTRSLRCPECRADHFVPRGGPAKYPNNLTIIGFLSLDEDLRTTDTGSGSHHNRCRQIGEGRNVSKNGNGDDNVPNEIREPLEEFVGEVDDVALPQEQLQQIGRRPRRDGGCSICHNDAMILRCCHCDNLVCDDCRQDHMHQVSELVFCVLLMIEDEVKG